MSTPDPCVYGGVCDVRITVSRYSACSLAICMDLLPLDRAAAVSQRPGPATALPGSYACCKIEKKLTTAASDGARILRDPGLPKAKNEMTSDY